MRNTMIVWSVSVLVGAVLLIVSCRSMGAAGSQSGGQMSATRVSVNAGQHERVWCPVQVEVEGALARLSAVSLVDDATGVSIPAQIAQWEGKYVLSFVIPHMDKDERRSYRLVEREAGAAAVTLTRKDEPAIDVTVAGQPVTTYHFSSNYKKPFMYPVLGSDGARMTRGWPMEEIPGEPQDHPHQKSFWVAHGDVNGVDFWGEGRGSGTQRTDEIVTVLSGDVCGAIRARNSWMGDGDKKILSEERCYVYYNTPPELRIVDLSVRFGATEGEVVFGDTKEGGLAAFRVNPVINADRHGEIQNSVGAIGEREAWGKRASWCDYNGPIDDKRRGIAVLDNPMNPRYPTCWHVRGYGLMGANCFGYSYFKSTYEQQGDFTLPAGESVTFRYRVLIHDGDAVAADIAARYADYILPPDVKVSR
jgi:hypothetical protein